jgi:HAD superfamily hydrolase (TIGR01509 family)
VAGRKVRAVIFDIGRVLIRIDVGRAMKGMASGLSLSAEELWSAIEKDPRWKDWQEGRITARDWHLYMQRRFGGSATFEEFTEKWNLVLDPEPIHRKEFFEKLAKKYRLALLSNTDPIHVAHMEGKYDFFSYFPAPARIYSCSVRATKPSPIIYREALQACRVRAEEAVYIDDIEAYVTAAKQLGMAGIQFKSPEQLVSSLQELGLTV